ncbi:hypothetical protein [Kribbella turkmenica]|uniref:hypothetical protein n=1 Tax=Kribbella turkmenica TaxID=2530375 RepID=UPI001404B6BC|nr:hypothetical protein [Kribbella turkmenica]
MLTLLLLLALIVWALQLNHDRQAWPSTPAIARNGVPDRDLERLSADLRALR